LKMILSSLRFYSIRALTLFQVTVQINILKIKFK
jgi:hypothetical protein